MIALKLTEKSIFQIKNLKFHKTKPNRLVSILEKGILSQKEHKKENIEYRKSYGPETQKKYGMQNISVWDIDGEQTGREREIEEELKEHNVSYERNIEIGEKRREHIFGFFGQGNEICLVIHPSVKTAPKGLDAYEHLVEDKILPAKILGVCYSPEIETIYLKEDMGKKVKQQILETCKKYKKPVFEVNYDMKTIKKVG